MAIQFKPRDLEKTVRGYSWHRRIQIMDVLDRSDEPLSLGNIAKACHCRIHPIFEHVRRLYVAGLVQKTNRKREVLHELTPLGERVLAFLRQL